MVCVAGEGGWVHNASIKELLHDFLLKWKKRKKIHWYYQEKPKWLGGQKNTHYTNFVFLAGEVGSVKSLGEVGRKLGVPNFGKNIFFGSCSRSRFIFLFLVFRS